MNLYHLTYQTPAFISAPKIHTDLLWDLTFLFIGLGVVYFTAIFFFRNRMSAKSRRIADKKKSLGPMISEFLFYEENGSKEEKTSYVHLKIEIRELLKDKFNRIVLAEILLDLERDVSGDTHMQLCKLYYDLGLHLDAFKKLKSWRWELVSKGILELTRMQVDESYTFITKFINDKRGVIRKQAEIATVTLKHEGINYFLDTTRYKISEWQQLKLLDVIRNLDEFEPPRFKAWLTSKNKYVVLFALRLIKYYNQNDANESVIELIKHRNNQIKTEAINCIREFCVFDAIPMLKKVYWKCNIDVKLLILDTLGSIGSKEEIDFFKFVESKESNFVIKSKALSAINNIAPQTIMPTDGVATQIGEVHIPKNIEDIPIDQSEEVVSNSLKEDIAEKNILRTTEEVEESSFMSAPLEELTEVDTFEFANNVLDQHIKLDFLPVVVEDVSEEVSQMLAEETDQLTPSILDIEVECTDEDIDFVSLAFLPVVIEEEDQEKNSIAIHEIEVIAEAVHFEPEVKQDKEEVRESQSPSLTELEVVYEEVQYLNHDTSLQDIEVIIDEGSAPNLDTILALEVDATEVTPSIPEDISDIDVISEVLLPILEEEDILLIDLEAPFDVIEKEENSEEETIDFSTVDLLSTSTEEDGFLEASLLENMHYKLPESVFKQLYFDKDESNKILLLDTIGDVGDKREIPLLKEIIIQEHSTVLKERALEILNKVSEIQFKLIGTSKTLVNENDLKGESIFKTLFATGDTESKLLLIEEASNLGCWKEISFLEELADHDSREIRDKAIVAAKTLETRLNKLKNCESTEESLEASKESHISLKGEDTSILQIEDAETIDQVPLEFCFLLDALEIQTLEAEESDILELEFELEKDLTESINEELKNKNKTEESIAKNSLLESLLELPLKLIEKLNG